MSSCPLPKSQYDAIVLGHGSGGRLAAELLESVFLRHFRSEILTRLEDQAVFVAARESNARLALTTDSFVVRPPFFPGGDIGRLSICGTVNDLAVGGALPRVIAAAFILEEGLPLLELDRVVASMAEACKEAGVELVAGDTKVVERGKGDRLFITTTGVGVVPDRRELSVSRAKPGDRVLVSGPIGDHGIAILSVREGIEFETALVSDCAPLGGLSSALLEVCPGVRCMRDPTRGGLASALNEIAARSRVGIRLEASAIPVRPPVRAACELFGLDPLHVACEGRLVAIVAKEEEERALEAMRAHPLGKEAASVGTVVADHPQVVTLRSEIGSERLVPLLAGEQLPRIC
jgi:hydrogenase expression/formation protein HypE